MQNTESNAAAPEISGRPGDPETLIALSATPAPVAPPAIPAGTLRREFRFLRTDPTRNSFWVCVGQRTERGERRTLQEAVGRKAFLSAAGMARTGAPASGLGIGPTSREGGRCIAFAADSAREYGTGGIEIPIRGCGRGRPVGSEIRLSPQKVLGPKHVYTLHVNMPNLTSASGSWILNFAELNESMPG